MSYNEITRYSTEKTGKLEHFYKTIGEDWFTYPGLYSKVVEEFGPNSAHFVEVGSWKGRSAAYMAVEIANSGYNIKFDCVDTWEGSIEHVEMEEVKSKKLYEIFLSNVNPVIDYINPIKKSSLDAAKEYGENTLDFVFIDASHEYEDVKDDIITWLPKIKKGGILAGHDFGSSGVNKAVHELLGNRHYTVSEDCWILRIESEQEKLENINVNIPSVEEVEKDVDIEEDLNKVTLVTGLWNIKRDQLAEGWSRSYEHYLQKFSELLETDCNLIIYGDADLRSFVFERRKEHNTQFIERGLEFFTNTEFYSQIQKIRTNPDWYNLASWLKDSTQASLEMYNPLVMSKIYLLNDARILDKFGSKSLYWIDAGITNTVHKGYFNRKLLNKIPDLSDRFTFLAFPYEANNEIHGFEFKALCKLAKKNVNKVGRGGFFGGPKTTIDETNTLYYLLMQHTLSEGLMGTEESLFSILMYKYCNKYNYFEIEGNGLIYRFFEDLKNGIASPKCECIDSNPNLALNTNNTALYIITYNSPNQVKTLLKSMEEYDSDFIKKPRLFLLNNSTDELTFKEYDKICEKYGITEIHKNNIGICGGRQFIAEHAEENGFDFYFFFEDDMFFTQERSKMCKNGFNRYVPHLYYNSLEVIRNNGFDFLKLCYTEVYGDNGTQWAWYNIPQTIREEYFPYKPTLPERGTDPDAPRTKFNYIKSQFGIPFASGDIYYSNWPQVVSKEGNRKMFLKTKFEHPYEQTWMSFMFQETKKDRLNPGILLISPTEHDRFDFYPAEERREN